MGKVIDHGLLSYVRDVKERLSASTGVDITSLSFDLKKVENDGGDIGASFRSGTTATDLVQFLKSSLGLGNVADFASAAEAERFNLRRAALSTLSREDGGWLREADNVSGAVYRDEGSGRIARLVPVSTGTSPDTVVGFAVQVADNATIETEIGKVTRVVDENGDDAVFTHASSGYDIVDAIGKYEQKHDLGNAQAGAGMGM
jgi:hypothetical protein